MPDNMNIITEQDITQSDNTEITCCFTGHRELDPRRREAIISGVHQSIITLYARGYRVFADGGALGFDTVAAQTVLALRKNMFPDIKLRMVLPCRTQAEKWHPADRQIYRNLLAQADEVLFVSDAYYSGCMHARNRALVQMSSACIAYQTHNGGGTDYTVRYAQNLGIPVLKLR